MPLGPCFSPYARVGLRGVLGAALRGRGEGRGAEPRPPAPPPDCARAVGPCPRPLPGVQPVPSPLAPSASDSPVRCFTLPLPWVQLEVASIPLPGRFPSPEVWAGAGPHGSARPSGRASRSEPATWRAGPTTECGPGSAPSRTLFPPLRCGWHGTAHILRRRQTDRGAPGPAPAATEGARAEKGPSQRRRGLYWGRAGGRRAPWGPTPWPVGAKDVRNR